DQAERPRTRARGASGFSVGVIKSKISSRSAVRSSDWLDDQCDNIKYIVAAAPLGAFVYKRPLSRHQGTCAHESNARANIHSMSSFQLRDVVPGLLWQAVPQWNRQCPHRILPDSSH